MPLNRKTALRLAREIDEALAADQVALGSPILPTAEWQHCQTLLNKMNLAHNLNWELAANRCRRDLRESLHRLTRTTAEIGRQLAPPDDNPKHASAREIYADLITLHDEFDQISFDRDSQSITATTAPIELEGVYLGPFEIRVYLEDLSAGSPYEYRVIASDPQPAASDDSVTHPHIQDQILCEGAGRKAIQQALEQGRLLDFFFIVANTLQTYNSGSPYVSLENWQGMPCADCGITVNPEARWLCEKCEETLCRSCYINCSDCDGVYCSECVTRCERCNERLCNDCITSCSDCGDDVCMYPVP